MTEETAVSKLAAALEKMDRRHFIVSHGGKVRIGTDKKADGVTPSSMEMWSELDLKVWYRDHNVRQPILSADGELQGYKNINVAEKWLTTPTPNKRRFEEIVFDPSGKAPPDAYNLWTGFTFEPKPGDWSLFRSHIEEIICNEEQRLIDYTLGWMARAVQFPARPGETALVFRGAKGTGKGTFNDLFGRLFGPHYLQVSNPEHITGRFNSHLKETVLFAIDEGYWAGSREGEGILKSLITEPYLPVEKKYYDVEHVLNCLHITMSSNASWVVPASGFERRFCVLDMNDKMAQNVAYFAAIRKTDGGGRFCRYAARPLGYGPVGVQPPPPARHRSPARADDLLHDWHQGLVVRAADGGEPHARSRRLEGRAV